MVLSYLEIRHDRVLTSPFPATPQDYVVAHNRIMDRAMKTFHNLNVLTNYGRVVQ
jgi:hypothetical protein